MKFSNLLQYLDMYTEYDLLDGDPAQSLQKAQDETHKNPYAGELIREVFANREMTSIEDEVARIEFVHALGKMRLKYMADDAPVEGFRLVEKCIMTADAAYNEEALNERDK